MFGLADSVREMLSRSLAKIARYCSTVIFRGDANAFKRQLVSFLLRTNIRPESFQSCQPTLMLSAEYVEEVVPFISRNLLCRHSCSLARQLSLRPRSYR